MLAVWIHVAGVDRSALPEVWNAMKRSTAERRLREIAGILESADNRAQACDGAVSHVRDELTDQEWRRIWALAHDPPRRRRRKARR